jgi:hypothetical protein
VFHCDVSYADSGTVVEARIDLARTASIYLLQDEETRAVFASERRERLGTRYGDSLPKRSSQQTSIETNFVPYLVLRSRMKHE